MLFILASDWSTFACLRAVDDGAVQAIN